jgi:hypothetical protein
VCGYADQIVDMKKIILVLLCLLAGYLIFADKTVMMVSIKKRLFDLDLPSPVVKEPELQDVTPAPAPDYSDKDREHLDSILRDSQSQ